MKKIFLILSLISSFNYSNASWSNNLLEKIYNTAGDIANNIDNAGNAFFLDNVLDYNPDYNAPAEDQNLPQAPDSQNPVQNLESQDSRSEQERESNSQDTVSNLESNAEQNGEGQVIRRNSASLPNMLNIKNLWGRMPNFKNLFSKRNTKEKVEPEIQEEATKTWGETFNNYVQSLVDPLTGSAIKKTFDEIDTRYLPEIKGYIKPVGLSLSAILAVYLGYKIGHETGKRKYQNPNPYLHQFN